MQSPEEVGMKLPISLAQETTTTMNPKTNFFSPRPSVAIEPHKVVEVVSPEAKNKCFSPMTMDATSCSWYKKNFLFKSSFFFTTFLSGLPYHVVVLGGKFALFTQEKIRRKTI